MKDFYDIWLMTSLFDFNGQMLCDAIRNTFQRRLTKLPSGLPMAFTNEFWQDSQKQTQWRAFLHKSKSENVPNDFGVVIDTISSFLMPVVKAARDNKQFGKVWLQSGLWS